MGAFVEAGWRAADPPLWAQGRRLRTLWSCDRNTEVTGTF